MGRNARYFYLLKLAGSITSLEIGVILRSLLCYLEEIWRKSGIDINCQVNGDYFPGSKFFCPFYIVNISKRKYRAAAHFKELNCMVGMKRLCD